jgi:hypothetical protein
MSNERLSGSSLQGPEGLLARIEEHTAKSYLARQISEQSTEKLIDVLGEAEQIPVRDYMRAHQNEARVETDSLWVGALFEAGADVDIIQKAWDLKDQKARNLPKS